MDADAGQNNSTKRTAVKHQNKLFKKKTQQFLFFKNPPPGHPVLPITVYPSKALCDYFHANVSSQGQVSNKTRLA